LVNQQYVPIFIQFSQAESHDRPGLGGRLTRAAGEENQGVGFGAAVAGRHPGNPQSYFPAFGFSGIFGDFIPAAFRHLRDRGSGYNQLAVFQFEVIA
jgi:hypothetical protein